MLYNFEVWRDVQQRMQESPSCCSSPKKKLLSSKELLARRRPYAWVFDPQPPRALPRIVPKDDPIGPDVMKAASLPSELSLSRAESRVASISSGWALSASSPLTRSSVGEVESRKSTPQGSQRDSHQSVLSRGDALPSEEPPDPGEPGSLQASTQPSRRSTPQTTSTPASAPSEPPAVEVVVVVDREPMDPQVLRAMARRHGMVFPEVNKFWAIFDQLDMKGTGFIGKHEFEKLLYGCTMSPKKVRLPKHRLRELWQLANPDGSNQIDFEGFLTFYRKHVDAFLVALQY